MLPPNSLHVQDLVPPQTVRHHREAVAILWQGLDVGAEVVIFQIPRQLGVPVGVYCHCDAANELRDGDFHVLQLPPYAPTLFAAQDGESEIIAIAVQAHTLGDAASDSRERKDSGGAGTVAHY